tara:strand:+ start:2747 stop:3061 length:315 start_codon:yes stop_codon:yes gene_type:complete
MLSRRVDGLTDFREFFLLVEKEVAKIKAANKESKNGDISYSVFTLESMLDETRQSIVSELECIEKVIIVLLQEMHSRIPRALFQEITKAAGVRVETKPGEQTGH